MTVSGVVRESTRTRVRGALHRAHLFVLNYDAMRRWNLNPYAALLVLVAFFSACSGPHENSGSPDTSAPQQANSNSAPLPQSAQSEAPAAAPVTALPAVQPIPPPLPAEKSDAAVNANVANAANASAVDSARVPKLVVAEKKIDYGKQPQEKTLVRAIVVRNGGRADLKIESVVPS